jgi:adenosylcobinamide kinase / adenosylcobinamide-phosphate guanylyltransferase
VIASSLLILGGARSGKSRFALAAATAPGAFVATAGAGDADMAERIERHRRERPPAWRTVEEPVKLLNVLSALAADGVRTVIVDCITLWVGNLQLQGEEDDPIRAEIDALARLVASRAFELLLVSNEVGLGVHPETSVGLRFRELLGYANQRLAAACDRVILMVAGLPIVIKDQPERGTPHATAFPAS